MKQLLLLALVLSTSFFSQAQFDVTSGNSTGTTITIETESYPVYKTMGGSEYIVCHSMRTGNDYPVWIGVPTTQIVEGRPVRQTRSGKFFILVISSNSHNPYCKYLQ